MITLGVTTWSEHPALINGEERPVKLNEYAAHFPVVEVDNPFYGIPQEKTVRQWMRQVPESFQFILKANQLMTKHDMRSQMAADDDQRRQAFNDYVKMLQPLMETNQLKTVLFQFPPYFQRNNDNIRYLMTIRELMGRKVPIAVEFRNPTWTEKSMQNSIKNYLKRLGMTFVIADEPHNLNDGIELLPMVTTSKMAMLRLHGRNAQGWFNQDKNWRSQRTLYKYSEDELKQFADIVTKLNKEVDEVCVIFNNNSGRDAAPNALQLKEMLHVSFNDLAPMQLDLF